MSEKFCGEGVPTWAAIPIEKNFPEPIDTPFEIDKSTGFPYPTDCKKFSWPDYYEAEATCSAFQNLYDDFDGLQRSFANYWEKVAKEFIEFPNLLGYELLNEPWAGDIYRHPELLIPGEADYSNLQPMYNNINSAIRKVDNKHIIMFEGVTWDDFPVGFSQVPGGEHYQNRSVLAYHCYYPTVINIYETMAMRMIDLNRLRCGGFMTEFGITEAMNLADAFFQGWAQWEYKAFVGMTGWDYGLFFPNGSVNYQTVKSFSRTYATAIAGVGDFMSFDSSTSIFILNYEINPTCTQPTEIYLNEDIFYSKGFTVSIVPSDAAIWKKVSKNHIHIIHTTREKQYLYLSILPK